MYLSIGMRNTRKIINIMKETTMKSYREFVAEAQVRAEQPVGKTKGRQIEYKRMADLGDDPSNYEDLDLNQTNPHGIPVSGSNTTAKRLRLSNPSIVDSVLTKAQIERTRADIAGAAKNRHHIGPKVQGD
jgi:hypothetical protein